MKAVLVDDEKNALVVLERYLRKEEDIEIIGMYQDSLKAIEKIITDKPDVVFLDIDMPVINGISTASEILEHDDEIKIVFVTAYHEYATKAFDLNAVDYILKPIDIWRLKKTIERIRKQPLFEEKSEKLSKRQFIKENALKINISKIPVWENDKISLCDIGDINLIYGERGYVKISTCKGNTYVGKETLNYYENRLKEYKFYRCHKSFIVNLEKIEEIEPWFNNTYKLNLEGGDNPDVIVSKSYMKGFKGMFDI